MHDAVIADQHAVRIQRHDPAGVVFQRVAVDHAAMGKKKIEGAPTVADAVSSEVIARGIADRDVSRLGHVVIFDAVPAAVPEPQGIATFGGVTAPAGADAVVTNQAVCHLVQCYAEQHRFDPVVLDQQAISLSEDRPIQRIMRISAVAQNKAANVDVVALQGQDGSLAAAINDGLAAAFDGDRLVNEGWAVIGAGWQAQGAACRRDIYPGLQRLDGLDANRQQGEGAQHK